MSVRRLLLLASLAALVGFGIGDLERGNRLYRAGRFSEAVQAYEQALHDGGSSPELQYNLGTALLQVGRYAEAEQHLRAALSDVDPALRQRAFYNLGNRFLTDARKAEAGKQAGPLLDNAIQSYKQALRLAPADRQAKWNLELAIRDRDKQRQQQSQSGGGQSNQQQQSKSKGQGGGGGGAQQQGGSSTQGGASGQQGLSKEQAERILAAADQDERQLYRQRMQKGQRETRVSRDW